MAEYDPKAETVTVWGAAKIPHVNKAILLRLLGWTDTSRVRMVELHVAPVARVTVSRQDDFEPWHAGNRINLSSGTFCTSGFVIGKFDGESALATCLR